MGVVDNRVAEGVAIAGIVVAGAGIELIEPFVFGVERGD